MKKSRENIPSLPNSLLISFAVEYQSMIKRGYRRIRSGIMEFTDPITHQTRIIDTWATWWGKDGRKAFLNQFNEEDASFIKNHIPLPEK